MTVLLDVREEQAVRPERTGPAIHHLVLYGDFNCPWSYLASQRATLLEDCGVTVDWRAVEHAPWIPRRFSDSSVRFQQLREELADVESHLLPDEQLPHALSGFLPHTKAAVSGYAEAYGAGVADAVRQLLFEAFWLHGADLGDARLVRTLLVDAIRSGATASGALHDWGYAVDVTGGPVTTTAWRLIRDWRRAWAGEGQGTVPVLYVDGGGPSTASPRWTGSVRSCCAAARTSPADRPHAGRRPAAPTRRRCPGSPSTATGGCAPTRPRTRRRRSRTPAEARPPAGTTVRPSD
ncbi:MAG: DsbA family oxidoreductase [Nocardioidaceae bacterium]